MISATEFNFAIFIPLLFKCADQFIIELKTVNINILISKIAKL